MSSEKGGPSTRLKSFETKHCRIAYPIIANFNQFIPILESELVQFRGQSVQICNITWLLYVHHSTVRPPSPTFQQEHQNWDFLHTIQFISHGTLENVLHLEHELPNEWNVPDRYYLFYILGKMITCRPPSPPIHFFLIILLSVRQYVKGNVHKTKKCANGMKSWSRDNDHDKGWWSPGPWLPDAQKGSNSCLIFSDLWSFFGFNLLIL